MKKPTRPAVALKDLGAALAGTDVVLCCGAGGVGKTTVAAALAMAAVCNGRGRVLVLTIDPARRLADALGIEAFGNVERRVELPDALNAPVGPYRDRAAATRPSFRARPYRRRADTLISIP